MTPAAFAATVLAAAAVAAGPVIVAGSPQAFDSTPTTVTLTTTVQAGDVGVLMLAAINNGTFNLTITSTDAAGTNTNWVDYSSTGTDLKSGARLHVFPVGGTYTITVGKDGAATFVGEYVVMRGVDTANLTNGTVTAVNTAARSLSLTIPATTQPRCFVLSWTGANDLTAAGGFTYSDTLVAGSNSTSVGKQINVQTRNIPVAGAQAAMTTSWGAGSSNSFPSGSAGAIVFRGL